MCDEVGGVIGMEGGGKRGGKGNEHYGVYLMERSVEWCCIGWEGAEMREN